MMTAICVPTITFEIMFKNKLCSTTPTVWSRSIDRVSGILDHLEIQVNDKVTLVGDKSLIIRLTESRMVAFCSNDGKDFQPLYCNYFHGFESTKSCNLFGFIHDPNVPLNWLYRFFPWGEPHRHLWIPFNWVSHSICAIHCHTYHLTSSIALRWDA